MPDSENIRLRVKSGTDDGATNVSQMTHGSHASFQMEDHTKGVKEAFSKIQAYDKELISDSMEVLMKEAQQFIAHFSKLVREENNRRIQEAFEIVQPMKILEGWNKLSELVYGKYAFAKLSEYILRSAHTHTHTHKRAIP